MYLCRGTILLKYSTLILIFLQTCNARKSKHYCPPSACGYIRNISYPFHLNTDPKDCGAIFELACEDNQTVISFLRKKLYVQAINYDNHTIHLTDPALQTQDDLCSFRPQLNSNQYNTIFDTYYYLNDGYTIKRVAEPIFMFNCPFAVNNTFVDISGCKLGRHTYLRIGEMNASDVSDGCRAEFIGLTSWTNIKEAGNNISLSDFRQAILYGFELHYPSFVKGLHYTSFGKGLSVISWIPRISVGLLELFSCKRFYIIDHGVYVNCWGPRSGAGVIDWIVGISVGLLELFSCKRFYITYDGVYENCSGASNKF